MSNCTDPELGKLLHAYEIGILSEDDTERFEMHMLECEYCTERIIDFEEPMNMLAHDGNVRELIGEGAGIMEKPKSVFQRLVNQLWPPGNLVLKPAILLLILIAFSPAIYHGVRDYTQPSIRVVDQVYNVRTIRSASIQQISRDQIGDNAVITFFSDYMTQGKKYEMAISLHDSRPLIQEVFRFGTSKTVTIFLKLSELENGRYHVQINDPEALPSQKIQEYYFEIIQ